MAAPSVLRSVATNVTASSINVTFGATVNAGERPLIVFNCDGKTVTTGPSGWTERKEFTGPGPFSSLSVWTKADPCSGSEANTTAAFSLSASDDTRALMIYLSSDADIDNLVIGAGDSANSTGPMVAGSIDTVSDDNLVLALCTRDNFFSTYSEEDGPDGYSIINADAHNGAAVFAFHKTQASAGATGSADFGTLAAANNWCAVQIAVPSAEQVLTPSGFANVQGFGAAQIGLTLFASGAVNTPAFGAAEIGQDQVLSPSGLLSSHSFGTPLVSWDLLTPSGFANVQAFGAAQVLKQSNVSVYAHGSLTTRTDGATSLTAAGVNNPSGHPDTILVVFGSSFNHVSPLPEAPITSITYNGVELERESTLNYSFGGLDAGLWYLVDPPTGTHDLVLTVANANAKSIVLNWVFVQDVNQAAPIGASVDQTDESPPDNDKKVSITSTANDSLLLFYWTIGYGPWYGPFSPLPGCTELEDGVTGVWPDEDLGDQTFGGVSRPAPTIGTYTVGAEGVDAEPAMGTGIELLAALASQALSAAGFANTSAFGAPHLGRALLATGFQNSNAFGTPQLDLTLIAASFVNSSAFGAAAVRVEINPTGFANLSAFGTASVSPGVVSLLPSGLVSATAFGTAVVTEGWAISPPGLPSGVAFGATRIDLTIFASGYADPDGFGAALVEPESEPVFPPGLASTTALGSPTVYYVVLVDGYADADQFGTPDVIKETYTLTPESVGDPDGFGAATVVPGAVALLPKGVINRVWAIGQHVVTGGVPPDPFDPEADPDTLDIYQPEPQPADQKSYQEYLKLELNKVSQATESIVDYLKLLAST